MATTDSTLVIDPAGAQNSLTFTARMPIPSMNKIKISYVNPGVETAAESVTVTDGGSDDADSYTLYAITLRSVSGTLSTANQVLAFWNDSPIASRIATCALTAANDGTTSVTAMPEAAFSAGARDGTSLGYFDIDDAEDAGWKFLAEAPTGRFCAERLVDSTRQQQCSATAVGLLRATYEYDEAFIRKGGARSISNIGVAD